jgi:hypothetical protein
MITNIDFYQKKTHMDHAELFWILCCVVLLGCIFIVLYTTRFIAEPFKNKKEDKKEAHKPTETKAKDIKSLASSLTVPRQPPTGIPTGITRAPPSISISAEVARANMEYKQSQLVRATSNMSLVDHIAAQPHLEMYLASLHVRDLLSKLGMDPNSPQAIDSNALLQEYTSRFRMITKNRDKVILAFYTKLADSYFAKHGFRKALKIPWQIVASIRRLEQGMPYTIGDAIVLPYSMIRDILIFHEKNFEKGKDTLAHTSSIIPVKAFLEVLIHEKWHVIQRLHQDLFNEFYPRLFPFMAPFLPDTSDTLDFLRSSTVLHYTENPDSNQLLWYYIVPDAKTQTVKTILPYMALVPGPTTSGYRTCAPVQSALFLPLNDEEAIESYIPLQSLSFIMWQRLLPFPISELQDGSLYHPNELFASWMASQLITAEVGHLHEDVVQFLNTILR